MRKFNISGKLTPLKANFIFYKIHSYGKYDYYKKNFPIVIYIRFYFEVERSKAKEKGYGNGII